MRKIIAIIAAVTATVSVARSQIATLNIDMHGEYNIVVDAGDNTFVTISNRGDIIHIDTDKNIEYYNSIFDYQDGKVKSVGRVRFDYNNSVFEYKHAKINTIGSIRFDYWDDFDEWRDGKLKSVGGKRIEYFDRFSSDENKRGKPKTIGSLKFDYYGEIDSSVHGRFDKGLLKMINNKRYTYQEDRRGRILLRGEMGFDADGMRVRVSERLRR